MTTEHRYATDEDLDILAEWNHRFIQEEGHRNPKGVPELRERMRGWLHGIYRAVIFAKSAEPVAYALYREGAADITLRQLFVRRDRRRGGIGRAAIDVLRKEVWAGDLRLTVDVLAANIPAVAFWRASGWRTIGRRAVGYQDHCLTLEILPNKEG